MLMFVALPLISIVLQSFHTPHDAVLVEVENCGPFGCTTETTIDQAATEAVRAAEPMGKFVGFQIYLDRGHLAVTEVGLAWSNSESLSEFVSTIGNLPLYRALGFTLTYTFVVTPLLIILGLIVALAVNTLSQRLKGIVIFFSLLPMIVPPLVGSLVLFWMVDSRGVLGSALQWLANDPELSIKANTGLMWIWGLALSPLRLCGVLCRAANPAHGPARKRTDRWCLTLATDPLCCGPTSHAPDYLRRSYTADG